MVFAMEAGPGQGGVSGFIGTSLRKGEAKAVRVQLQGLDGTEPCKNGRATVPGVQ